MRATRPDLAIGVRLSAFDFVPFGPGADGRGTPMSDPGGWSPFGAAPDGVDVDLTEVHEAMGRFRELGIGMVCVTGGSPYYNPHIQRPAYFPPSDGYAPPNDPLIDGHAGLAHPLDDGPHPEPPFTVSRVPPGGEIAAARERWITRGR